MSKSCKVKHTKGLCKFKSEWLELEQYKDWIAPDPKDQHIARCQPCGNKVIRIGTAGKYNLDSHRSSETHKKRMDYRNKHTLFRMLKPLETSGSKPTIDSKPTGSTGLTSETSTISGFVSKDDVLKAEILWCLKIISAHYSYKSCEGVSDLFRSMFPDSNIAKRFSCGERKANYIVTHGLAIHFRELLLTKCKEHKSVVLLFDESYNSVTRNKQLDVHVRLWDDNRGCSRYLASVFMGHGRATDLLEAFQSYISKLNLRTVLQVSMDGPNVNLSFYEQLQRKVDEEYGSTVLNLGTCGLHIIHGAFKHGCVASTWDIGSLLRAIHTIFHETPARREDFTKLTGSSTFGKEFCQHRWLENVPVAQRALEMWANLRVYVRTVESGKGGYAKPDTKSFAVVTKAVKDNLTKPRLQAFISVAQLLVPFLTLYQTDRPMVPFLASDMEKLIRSLMSRFLKPDATEGKSLSALVDMKLDKDSIQKTYSKVDVGFTADYQLKELLIKKKISEKDAMGFRMQVKAMLQEITKRILKKAPVKYQIVRQLVCLDPREMVADKDRCVSQMKRVLSSLVHANRLRSDICDQIVAEFRDFLYYTVPQHRERMESFDPSDENQRIDSFLRPLMDCKSKTKLWEIVSQLLLLSHGQASVEQGFSVNRQMEVPNLKEATFDAQRLVYDHILACGGVHAVCLDRPLLNSVQASRSRYQAYLDLQSQKERKERDSQKRKSCAEEIDTLKKKKAFLEADILELNKSADILSEKAESTRNLSFVTKSNSLRRTAVAKKDEMAKISSELDALFMSLKN